MDVHPFLLIGENLEHIATFPSKNWTHTMILFAKIDNILILINKTNTFY